jgi:hypothetical protein
MRRVSIAILFASFLLGGPASATIDPEMLDDPGAQVPEWMRLEGVERELPCSPVWDLSTGLPPCALPRPLRDRQRDNLTSLQQTCRSVLSTHGRVTVCVNAPGSR